MQAGVQVDPAEEYEAAAEFVAQRYGRPICAQLVQALVAVPQHVLDDIEANPDEWEDRVHAYARAIADKS